MQRREFIKQLSCGVLLLSAAPLVASGKACRTAKRKTLRFGVVSDAHYADREMAIHRYYRQSLDKMRAAVKVFNRSDLDFIVELGDLKDMGPGKDPAEALRFLDDIEQVLQSFRGPVYHVLGNHDEDCISKTDFLSHTRNPRPCRGLGHYSFNVKGVRFIVLDANFNADMSDYDRGNFDWRSAWLPPEELAWLERELSAHPSSLTCVFVHQMLDRFSDISKQLCVGNADDAVAILERHPQVAAVFQGHHHPGHYSFRNGIHYWTCSGMIEGEFPEHNAFAIVEVRPDGNIYIEGFGECQDRELDTKPGGLIS